MSLILALNNGRFSKLKFGHIKNNGRQFNLLTYHFDVLSPQVAKPSSFSDALAYWPCCAKGGR